MNEIILGYIIMQNEIWKTIPLPLYYNYQISNLGRVRVFYTDVSIKYLDGNISKAGYRRVKLVTISKERRTYFVHRLVALSFLPIPVEGKFNKCKRIPRDNIPYHVNHIDNNRCNNESTNIEWCDAKFNHSHSLNTNYSIRTVNCIMHDVITGENTIFKTAKDLGKFFGINPANASTIINNHISNPYIGRYTFITNTPLYNKNRIKSYSLICKDFVNNVLLVADNFKDMSILTGVKASYIRNKVLDFKSSTKFNMIAGYVFMLISEHNGTWPIYNKNDALKSRNQYFYNSSMGITKGSKGLLCKDFLTGELFRFESIVEASKFFHYNRVTLIRHISRDDFILYDGKVFIFEYDEREWPDIDKQEAELSKITKVVNVLEL